MSLQLPHIHGGRPWDRLLDLTRDASQRAKHLRWLCDSLAQDKMVKLLQQHKTIFFYSTYEHFANVLYDASNDSLKCATKEQIKEANTVSEIVQTMVSCSYDSFHERWHSNAMRRLTNAYLKSGHANALRLFIGWYCALGMNANAIEHSMFENLINEESQDSAKLFAVLLVKIGNTIEALPDVEGAARKMFRFILDQLKQIYLPKLFLNFTDESAENETRSELCHGEFISWLVSFFDPGAIMDTMSAYQEAGRHVLRVHESYFCMDMFRQACMSKLHRPRPLLKAIESAEFHLAREMDRVCDSDYRIHDIFAIQHTTLLFTFPSDNWNTSRLVLCRTCLLTLGRLSAHFSIVISTWEIFLNSLILITENIINHAPPSFTILAIKCLFRQLTQFEHTVSVSADKYWKEFNRIIEEFNENPVIERAWSLLFTTLTAELCSTVYNCDLHDTNFATLRTDSSNHLPVPITTSTPEVETSAIAELTSLSESLLSDLPITDDEHQCCNEDSADSSQQFSPLPLDSSPELVFHAWKRLLVCLNNLIISNVVARGLADSVDMMISCIQVQYAKSNLKVVECPPVVQLIPTILKVG
ncbi:hypothetical protein ACOME3_004150 [Neoechinorhynchus agilis]